MSEARKDSLPPRLTISHDEAIRSPQIWAKYRDERVALIKAGQPVWMLPGIFGEDATEKAKGDLVLDYYQGGGRRGFIEGNELDGFQVYAPEIEEGMGPHHLNGEPVGLLSEARRMLEGYIQEAYLAG